MATIRTSDSQSIYDLKYPGAAIDAILDTAYDLQNAGYIFRGLASEYYNTPTERSWVLAGEGETGHGFTSPVPKGYIGVCVFNGTSWTGKLLKCVSIDSTPTSGSTNAVSSGGAYAAINQLSASVTEALENLTFTDTTPSAFQDEYINMKVSTTEGGVERILTYLTILAATTSKAGLLSAEDKVKIDSFLTNLRSLTFTDTTASADQGTKITETLKATIGGVQEVIDSITLLAATSSKAGLLSASDKAYIDALPATLTSLSNSISGALALMQSLVGYYVCDTAAGTAAKTVAATGYSLTNGGCIRIKMTNANTADNVTLNINSTGAKALYYDGAQASSSNRWDAGDILEVFYDGTQYQCASGGGGKFATGEKVKEVSITDQITENSHSLIESGTVYDALYSEALDNSLTEGYYLQGTSSESRVANANWGYTDYIPAVNGDTIKSVFGTNVTTPNLTCVAYYNASKQFLAAWSANGYNNSRDGMTINNANAAYIRANIYLPNKQNCGVYINGTQVWGFGRNTDGIQKQIDNINDEIDDFEETFAVTDDVTENSTSPISSGGVWDAIYGHRENALTQGCMKVNNNVFSIVSSTDWGYTDFIPASNGDIVDSIFGVDARSLTGIVCIAYFDSNKNYLAAWNVGGYNNRRSGMTINNENAAYIRGNIYWSSRENCAIYINGTEVWGYDYQGGGIEPRIGILETDVDEIDERLDVIEDTLDEVGASGKVYLPLLSLINSDTAGGKISSSNYDTKRVVTKCATCFPVENIIWKVKCPTTYSLYVWLGNSAAGSFTLNEGGWIGNGLSFTTTGKKSYRVVFRKGDGNGALPVSEIQALVDSGDIAIYTEIKEESVFERNLAKDVEVGALRRILISDLAGNGMNSMFMFGHLSDVHGDAPRMKNFLDYCDNFLDVVCVSGDSTMYQGSSDFTEYQEELAKAHNLDFLFCIGNHEAYPTGQSNLYGRYMQRLATEYSYLKAGDTVTDVCYWYKDYADKNIRIIAINYYEGGVYSGCLGQAQITWFINTLASTPAGYGVIVMLHSPEDAITVEPPYDIFKQKHRIWNGQPNGFYVGDRPISHIIDAFISKGAYTGSYTESTSEAVTINADFSQVDVSTEFIAFVVGHLHEDWIGYYSHATNKQLSLGITTGNALYGDSSNPAWSNQSDLPRGDRGTCQDAFNIYAIDRINKYVKIVRIGADITETFVERKMMMIPYKDV